MYYLWLLVLSNFVDFTYHKQGMMGMLHHFSFSFYHDYHCNRNEIIHKKEISINNLKNERNKISKMKI